MFRRTLKALQSDTIRGASLLTLVALLLVAGWGSWLFRRDLPDYAVSQRARTEVSTPPFPVESPVRGRLLGIHIKMGDEVKAGDLLFELESASERLELKSAKRRLATLEAEQLARKRQVDAESTASVEVQRAAEIGSKQARARLQEVQAAEAFVEHSARSTAALAQAGAVSEIENRKADSALKQLVASRQSSQLDVTKKQADLRVDLADRKADLADLEHELVLKEGERAELEVKIETLEHEIEKRMIRAPGAGRVGDVAKLQLGAWVEDGASLASIVPSGDLLIVAEFEPDAALGRIHEGQRARMHLDGFPWTQFGMIEGHVSSVGSELRGGLVRVDITIEGMSPVLPRQHGLPGVAEVMVESCSPAELVLRALGRH